MAVASFENLWQYDHCTLCANSRLSSPDRLGCSRSRSNYLIYRLSRDLTQAEFLDRVGGLGSAGKMCVMMKCVAIHQSSGRMLFGELADRIAKMMGFVSTTSFEVWRRLKRTRAVGEAEDLAFESPSEARCVLKNCQKMYELTKDAWYDDTADRLSMLLGEADCQYPDWVYRDGEHGPGND